MIQIACQLWSMLTRILILHLCSFVYCLMCVKMWRIVGTSNKMKVIVGAFSGHGEFSRKSHWQLYPQSVPPGCEGSGDVKLPGSVFPQSFTFTTLILIITLIHGLALKAKFSVYADTSFSLTEELPGFSNLLHGLHHQLFRSILIIITTECF